MFLQLIKNIFGKKEPEKKTFYKKHLKKTPNPKIIKKKKALFWQKGSGVGTTCCS